MPFLLQGSGVAAEARVRAVVDSVFQRPEYVWRERPDPWAPVRRAWHALAAWLDALHDRHAVAWWLLVAVLVAALALIIAHAARVAWHVIRADASGEVTAPRRRAERRDAAWYGREAERLEADGRYAEAMQADFHRLLLELDARRLVRFHPSRTPGEYTREPSLSPEARRALQELVSRLYLFVFARQACGAEELRDWRSLASLERYARA